MMGKMTGVYSGMHIGDLDEGVWLKTDLTYDNKARLMIDGEVAAELSIEQARQLWASRNEAINAERKRILKLLEENLNRFDYSNNGCDQLSFNEFAKMTER